MERVNKVLHILAWPGLNFQESNLYNHLLYSTLNRLDISVIDFNIWNFLFSDYQIWHLHWPEIFLSDASIFRAYIKTFFLFILIIFGKLRGKKIIWTVHNLSSHEHYHTTLEKYYWNFFPRLIDGYICLSEVGRRSAIQLYPDLNRKIGCVIPHGHYRDSYKVEIDKETCRQRIGLKLELITLLFFGSIREYKNVVGLLSEFEKLGRGKYQLVIAGKPHSEKLKNEILDLAKDNEDIILNLVHINHDEIPSFFCSADLVVLPYTEMLNSGVALLSLSLNRPVLAPCLGMFPELRNCVGTEWVHTYEGKFSGEFIEQALLNLPGEDEVVDLSSFDWERIAFLTKEFYLGVLNR